VSELLDLFVTDELDSLAVSPYLTLPCHTGQTFYRLALWPLQSPPHMIHILNQHDPGSA